MVGIISTNMRPILQIELIRWDCTRIATMQWAIGFYMKFIEESAKPSSKLV